MSHKTNDVFYDHLIDWLVENSSKVEDILADGQGHYYVNSLTEIGTAGEEGYDMQYKRIYLPDQFQGLNL